MKQVIVLIAMIALGLAIGTLIYSFHSVFDTKVQKSKDAIDKFDVSVVEYKNK